MKLLIVVDKLLTGFDAPAATYLYMDKSMQDHGLFQAICRVNRLDDGTKDYGQVVDYKDLFKSLSKSITDYTSEAFDDFDKEDVEGMLVKRLEVCQTRLETSLETVIALCEPVHPKTEFNFVQYFCGNTQDPHALQETEVLRIALYKSVGAFLRAYLNIASELHKIGYDDKQAAAVKDKFIYYSNLQEVIKLASGDHVDMKSYESGMRMLLDMYIDAKDSKKISYFDNEPLVEFIKKVEEPEQPYKTKQQQDTIAETIENNVRKTINSHHKANPKYFDKMSELLEELITLRKEERLDYEAYLKRVKKLADQVDRTSGVGNYPLTLNTRGKQALYDNLENNEVLALAVHQAVQKNKNDDWRYNLMKERKVRRVLGALLDGEAIVDQIMDIIRTHREY